MTIRQGLSITVYAWFWRDIPSGHHFWQQLDFNIMHLLHLAKMTSWRLLSLQMKLRKTSGAQDRVSLPRQPFSSITVLIMLTAVKEEVAWKYAVTECTQLMRSKI